MDFSILSPKGDIVATAHSAAAARIAWQTSISKVA